MRAKAIAYDAARNRVAEGSEINAVETLEELAKAAVLDLEDKLIDLGNPVYATVELVIA